MSPLELFSFEACPYAQRTRMTLIEKGVDFKLTEIDLFDRPAWFSEISPYGKVPALRHDGTTLYESTIINQYLDEVFPEPPLMPARPIERAQARIWMDYCETRFLPVTHRLMTERDDPERKAANLAAFADTLRFIEREGLRKLGDGPYFFGTRPTLVDLQFCPFFERFGTYERLAGAEWPADCTRLTAWFAAMQTRPSFKATARPVEYHLEARKNMLARLTERRGAAAQAG